ncbi:TPA: Bro-N domain-containing protein [Salmonella enterica]|uniref:Bro-N domain-containing protein n=1 Tax=Salmonella enterica TaxID=28901 RepID=A0A759H299_SALER|nr:Bro-N domain-containing protein [Salmonella enterica]UMY45064.1 Bro-N domain-containing protein [Salmonella enterica]HAG1882577.1 Bro-N domain-containing protein [Salmonella enterica]HAG5358531.1 Bro-N domain-containing protein [Salmonella enterica]
MRNVAKKELVFHGTKLIATTRKGQIWFAASDLARALQYSNTKSITNLYNQNADEFSPGMSQVIESVTSGNYRKRVRIFSLRGAHLLAMFARTPIAKEFRRWVLDVLEQHGDLTTSPVEQRLALKCPDCNSPAQISHIQKLHRLETVMHVKCTNRRCGIAYLVSARHQHQIAPSHDEPIKQLINAMSEEEKSLTLGLLLRS